MVSQRDHQSEPPSSVPFQVPIERTAEAGEGQPCAECTQAPRQPARARPACPGPGPLWPPRDLSLSQTPLLAQGRSSWNSCTQGDCQWGGRGEWGSINERGRQHFGVIKHFFFSLHLLEFQELRIFGNQLWSEGYQFCPIN